MTEHTCEGSTYRACCLCPWGVFVCKAEQGMDLSHHLPRGSPGFVRYRQPSNSESPIKFMQMQIFQICRENNIVVVMLSTQVIIMCT